MSIQFTVPDGAVPGQSISIQLQDGSSVAVAIPSGAMPGQVIQVQIQPQVIAAPGFVSSPPHYSNVINEAQAIEFLKSQRWPGGLQQAFVQITRQTPLHFFICDNSGSMANMDIRRLVGGTNPRLAHLSPCTRWTELCEMLRFHAQLAEAAQHTIEFHFLNDHAPIVVGTGKDGGAGINQLQQVLSTSPAGGTPLCQHIRIIEDRIRNVENQLRANSQNVLLVIATDGESSDGDVVAAIRRLANLPVWVTIRLCTEDENVVRYWNQVDQQLVELKLDIVEDFIVEGRQVHQVNPWMTYGEPLQRLREFGLRQKELDLAQQRRLNPDEMRRVCALLLFNNSPQELGDPVADWPGFIKVIKQANLSEVDTWNPHLQRPRDWIFVGDLTFHYDPNRAAAVFCSCFCFGY